MPDKPCLPAYVDDRLMAALSELVLHAADTVLRLRGPQLAMRKKRDSSPVTAADEASQAVLLNGLSRLLPGIPVVAEEQAHHQALPAAPVFVLIDPLDGTREYIAGLDEFTINVGLIAHGVPIAGLVAAPARHTLWRGILGQGAERLAYRGGGAGQVVRVRTRTWPGSGAVALVSRSHLDAASAALLDRARIGARQPCGSALKFCLLAEGAADLYPRLAPTCYWDVAAGHAVLTAAGGAVVAPDAAPLHYGESQSGLRIAGFIACGDSAALSLIG